MVKVNREHRDDRARRRTGSAAVEAAIVLPFLLMLAIGATDFGRFSYAYISVATAARNGAQYGSTSISAAQDKKGIANTARAEMSSVYGVTSSNPSVKSKRIKDGDVDTGDDVDYADSQDSSVRVTVSFQFNTLIRYPGLPKSLTLVRTVRMRVLPK